VNGVSRTNNYLSILDATSKLQFNVALILESEAVHAEKSRNWICNHLSTAAYLDNAEHLKQTVDIHEQLIAVIDGITKMEVALAKNLEILIGEKEESSALSGGMGGDLFGFGGMEK
jgi:hypothetical protein